MQSVQNLKLDDSDNQRILLAGHLCNTMISELQVWFVGAEPHKRRGSIFFY